MTKENNWHPETASLLASLTAHGFTIIGGDNGDGMFRFDSFPSESAFLDELLACEECSLIVRRKATKESLKTPGKMVYRTYFIFIVLGNSPGELVSDWGIPSDKEDSEALDKAITDNSDKWEGKAQPVRPALRALLGL